MSNAFRELLKKVGSGVHTGKDLTRAEAEAATRMILLKEATPAQIGAFMIAHRIKRPTAEELAGMLDAYDDLIPRFETNNLPFSRPITVLGTPYDGRDRTAPVTPITALILAAAGVPTFMHGGDTMATKYGIPLIEIWPRLGVDFTSLSLLQAEQLLEKTGIGFFYFPRHFPPFKDLVAYRDEIGKRPPFATIELILSPWVGNVHFVSGFVHPPTEERFRETFALRGVTEFTTIKGLEGSCDLPSNRTAIIGIKNKESSFERLLLRPGDYGFAGKDVPLESPDQLIAQIKAVIQGKASDLMQTAIYNGGFYLWRFGVCADLEASFGRAEEMLIGGAVEEKLGEIIAQCSGRIYRLNKDTLGTKFPQ